MRKIRIQVKNWPKTVYRLMKWHFFYYFFKKTSPVLCVFYITDRCLMKCRMCNLWKSGSNDTLSLDLFKKTIKDLSKSCCYVTFSGGEPLLVEDIIERIVYSKRYIPHVHLVSNGYLLDEKMAKKLAATEIDEISVSIDGPKDIHDKIRGVEGAFERAIAAVNNLKKYAPKINVVINTTVAPWNIDGLPGFIDFVESLGVKQQFQPICNIFESGKFNDYTQPIIDRQKIKKLITKITSKKHIINSKYFISKMIDYFSNQKQFLPLKERSCNLSSFYIEIKPNGMFYSCGIVFNDGRGFSLSDGLMKVIRGREFKQNQLGLRGCKLCSEGMYVCYLEPRIAFPAFNFFKYQILGKKLSRKFLKYGD
jgi:MoaA/NifB/PqqE/SkfB family radical SAM enzyme